MIQIIGLGVTDGDLSIRSAVAIDTAEVIIVKTKLTPTFNFFTEYQDVITCDDLYDSAQDFESLDIAIVDRVMQYKDKRTVYCVDGSGIDDNSVVLLKKLYPQLEFLCGVARDTALLQHMPSTAYTAISAYDLANNVTFEYDSDHALVVKDIDSDYVASMLKTTLTRLVGDECKVRISGNDIDKEIAIYELDRQKVWDYSCGLIIPPQPLTNKHVYNYSDLMKIMYRLRADDGCPWDKEQTHQSIRSNVLEESYELCEAIDNDDIDNIIEESGDVILQGVFHTVIGADEGEFESQEVLTTLCKKLISRHTHIFGNVTATNADEALNAWENAKAKEKQSQTSSSKMLRIATTLPANMRAEKIQKIAQKSGFDFANALDASQKIAEELQEYLQEKEPFAKELEGGDLLFAVINVLRLDGIKSEVALNRALNKFANRYSYIEDFLIQQGKSVQEMSAEQLDDLWEQAKANENS